MSDCALIDEIVQAPEAETINALARLQTGSDCEKSGAAYLVGDHKQLPTMI